MRLIDADALKDALGDTRDGEPIFRPTEFLRMDIIEKAIDEAPTGIIFCRECEYYKTPQKYAYNAPNPYCCRSALVKVSEDDFCSKAKKRGDPE